jgi:2-dehydro-3-deoxy-D-arabinonate dehydratase
MHRRPRRAASLPGTLIAITLAATVKLYRTATGAVVEHQQQFFSIPQLDWDELIAGPDLHARITKLLAGVKPVRNPFSADEPLLAPMGSQEVWAAGVTYFRSRAARIEESKSSGGGDFYDRVYSAERPELFFKATPNRVVGHRDKVAIRSDATWSVPEPELTLLVSSTGEITGYTIGNDMSSRDIEGENPLYLPQAKVYNRSCALGPCILITNDPPAPTTTIQLQIIRGSQSAFEGSTTLSSMKRELKTLVAYLFRDNVFPRGCFLLTGTGIVPPDSFTLQHGDEIRITIEGIGTLINSVA